MTQNDNIQADTPAQGANDEQYASLEEAVFGNDSAQGSGNISDIFNNPGNEGNVEQAPEQGQPSVNEGVDTQEVPPVDGTSCVFTFSFTEGCPCAGASSTFPSLPALKISEIVSEPDS